MAALEKNERDEEDSESQRQATVPFSTAWIRHQQGVYGDTHQETQQRSARNGEQHIMEAYFTGPAESRVGSLARHTISLETNGSMCTQTKAVIRDLAQNVAERKG